MDIVKQRKKRLMAWILTIVFCVSMWPGNVQATEGEDSLSGNNMEDNTLSGNGMYTPVNESTLSEGDMQNYPVMMALLDDGTSVVTEGDGLGESGETAIPTENANAEHNINIHFIYREVNGDSGEMGDTNIPFLEDAFSTNWDETNQGMNADGKTIEWTLGNSGQMYGITGYTGDSLDISDKYFEGKTNYDYDHIYKHNVLKWSYLGMEEGEESPVQKEKAGGTIFIDEMAAEGEEAAYNVFAILGKSVNVTFWEAEGSSGTYNPLEISQVGYRINYAQGLNSTGEVENSLEIILPKGGNENGFITGWHKLQQIEQDDGSINREADEADSTIPGEIYKKITSYDGLDFKTELEFCAVYAKKVPTNGGTYYLVPNTAYNFESGYYMVSQAGDEQGDGFVYNGNSNDNGLQQFYITGDEAEYIFTPVAQ